MICNVACGDKPQADMVNVDLRPTGDVVADVAQLPFRDGAFHALVARDILEHFPWYRTGAVLTEWHRVLTVGGWLTLKVPNLERIAITLIERPDAVRVMVNNIYGGHRFGPDGAWDTHHWGWTPDSLEQDLDRYGFEVESNNHEINMTVEAVKP